MASAKILITALVVVGVSALPKPDSPPYGHSPPSYKEPGMPYEFAYGVLDEYSGNDFAHDEVSDGKVTSGSYRVLLADGRTQVVTFTADHENGYKADVTIEGEIKLAGYKPAKAPAYPSTEPVYSQ